MEKCQGLNFKYLSHEYVRNPPLGDRNWLAFDISGNNEADIEFYADANGYHSELYRIKKSENSKELLECFETLADLLKVDMKYILIEESEGDFINKIKKRGYSYITTYGDTLYSYKKSANDSLIDEELKKDIKARLLLEIFMGGEENAKASSFFLKKLEAE